MARSLRTIKPPYKSGSIGLARAAAAARALKSAEPKGAGDAALSPSTGSRESRYRNAPVLGDRSGKS